MLLIFFKECNKIHSDGGIKMKKFKEFITNHSLLVVIISCVLLIPSIIGYYNTKVNYDILVYLPEDIETIKGQNILTDEFGIGAFSFVTTNMSNYDILTLEKEIRKIDGVEAVASIADVTDTLIPSFMIPEEIINKVYKDDETVILVTFHSGTSEEKTMNAVKSLRETVGDATKVSGMTAMVLDTRELSEKEIFAYIVIAVLLCLLVLIFATDSYLVPVFLLGNIGVAILYNMGTNIFLGQISYITKAITAVLQLGVTMDFSIFLYHKYIQAKEQEKDKKKAMGEAISETFKSVIGSSLTTIAGFLALCSMDLTLGTDIGIVMAKGVLLGVICVITVLPAMLLTFDKLIEKTRHKEIMPKFTGIKNIVINHYKVITIIFIIILPIAIYGYTHTEVYYNLDKSLPETLESVEANNTLKQKFNIVSAEVLLVDREIPDYKVNEMLNKIEEVEGIEWTLGYPKVSGTIPESILPNTIKNIFENDKYYDYHQFKIRNGNR